MIESLLNTEICKNDEIMLKDFLILFGLAALIGKNVNN